MIDKEKYALVYKHKGIGIYTLKVAGLDDEKGYKIDHDRLPGVYGTVGEAVEAIDTYLVRKKLKVR